MTKSDHFPPLKPQPEIDFERGERAALIALAIIAGLALAGAAGVGLLAFGITSDPVASIGASGFAG